jgi:hypothetical protein
MNKIKIKKDVTIINQNAFDVGAPNFTKQILLDLEEEMGSDILIIGYFNTQFPSTATSSR